MTYESDKDRYGSILDQNGRTILKDTAIISRTEKQEKCTVDLTADEMAGVESLTWSLYADAREAQERSIRIILLDLPGALEGLRIQKQASVALPSSFQLQSKDISISGLTAVAAGDSYKFSLSYDFTSPKTISIFDPPGGTSVLVYEAGKSFEGTGIYDFFVPAADLIGVMALTIKILGTNMQGGDYVTVPNLRALARLGLGYRTVPPYEDMLQIGIAIKDGSGRLLLPIRALFEAAGYTVIWNGGSKSVHIFINGVEQLVFTVGSSIIVIEHRELDIGLPVLNLDGTTYAAIEHMGIMPYFVEPETLALYVKPPKTPVPAAATPEAFVNNLTATGSGVAREVPAVDYKSAAPVKLTAESAYPRWVSQNIGEADVRWLDCNGLTKAQRDILSGCTPNITFNTDTIFPDMPEGYDPAAILEAGKNPGLGVRALQARGITGKGVGIAIIDQPLYTNHPEYRDNLALYEEIHVIPSSPASTHGSAVSSIAVGKSCGVAPGATLYYWGVDLRKSVNDQGGGSDASIAFADALAVAVDRVIEVNDNLPADRKIRVISISRGFSDVRDAGVQTFLGAVKRAEKAGIFVITTSTSAGYDWLDPNVDAAGLGKQDYAGDPDALPTYTLGTWEQSRPELFLSKLLVPMDARTTADFTKGDGYVFYSDGGWSWVAPYMAGLYAMACQVRPEVTPEQFWQTALNTADSMTIYIQTGADTGAEYTFRHVVNPIRLIEALEK